MAQETAISVSHELKERLRLMAFERRVPMTHLVDTALTHLESASVPVPPKPRVRYQRRTVEPVRRSTPDRALLARVCAAALRGDPMVSLDVAELLAAQ